MRVSKLARPGVHIALSVPDVFIHPHVVFSAEKRKIIKSAPSCISALIAIPQEEGPIHLSARFIDMFGGKAERTCIPHRPTSRRQTNVV